MKTVPAILALTLLASTGHVYAQSGDPARGLSIASEVCAECHAIRQGQPRSPNARSPTFPQIAAVPGMTATALTVTLTTPTPACPCLSSRRSSGPM
jgi:mono/diheme cytochrome c family protein